VNISAAHLAKLSPLPKTQSEHPSLRPLLAEKEDTVREEGPSWGKVALASLALIGASSSAVYAQVAAPQVQPSGPLVVAHRGSTEQATENTLEAFQHALDEGANALELDVHLTSDGDLAVIHDDTLDRTHGRPGTVRQMTSQELREAGVPMLQDVLNLPETTLIVEIKHPKGGRHQGVEQILVDQLERAGALERTVVISFDEQSLRTLHQLEPDLATGYLYSGKTLDPAQAKLDLGIDYLGPHFSQVTPEYVEQAHQAGLKVNPWTVNQVSDLQRMVDLGVDAITTDQPDELAQLLD
jgi:glycerophosphoryl diester phosphodiesterase